jgi:hypothetical protein
MNDERIWVLCDCYCHALAAYVAPEGDVIEVAFWQQGHPDPPSVKDRLRHIWQIIRHGHPYTDSVILDRDNIMNLVAYLEAALGHADLDA